VTLSEKRNLLEKVVVAALVSKVEVREGSHEKVISLLRQFVNEELVEESQREQIPAAKDGKKQGESKNF
jgi:hypothetical protein